ncbi:hypothetical protein [Micromonospora sp. L32]|uniref:hypothetical protein n=1 Tax=Micromonospora sp. L32 TaxID=3452214 RepID=UPI003F8A07A6
MTDFTAHDIHLIDQGAVDALRAVDALAADPETARRLAERGEAVYGAELTADLHNTVGGRAMSLAGWAAFATIRLVQAQARHTVDHGEAARMWAEDVDMVWAKVDERDAELEKVRAELAEIKGLYEQTAIARDKIRAERNAEIRAHNATRAQLTDANRALDGYKADERSLTAANTALANERDAMRVVVDAAKVWRWSGDTADGHRRAEASLMAAIDALPEVAR